MNATDVKLYVIEDNKQRMMMMKKKAAAGGLQSMSTDLGGAPGTADDSNVQGYSQVDPAVRAKILNETMPAGVINTNSSNTIRQSSLENGVRLKTGATPIGT